MNIERLLSLKPGDIIFEADYQIDGVDYFEHEVVSVDIKNGLVYTLDKSQSILYKGGKPSKISNFFLLKEINPQKYRDSRIDEVLGKDV